MRLNIPTDVTFVNLIGGPGTTEMLDALLELHMMDKEQQEPDSEPTKGETPHRPQLRFTAVGPGGGKFNITIDLIDMEKMDDYYFIYGSVNSQLVGARYRLERDEEGNRGILADRRFFRK